MQGQANNCVHKLYVTVLALHVQTYSRLQKFGISMSYWNVRKIVARFGDGFDEQVKR